jgi:hypothetical protein
MRGSRGRRVAVALLVAVAVAAAGCSSGGSSPARVTSTVTVPPSAGSSSVPVSSSASATISPPVLPAAARRPTRAGAEAFFRYFVATYSYAFSSLDAQPLQTVSDPQCSFCASVAADIQAAKASGQTFVNGEVSVVAAVAAPDDPAQGMLVNAVISQSESRTVDGAGATIRTTSPIPHQRADAVVRWTGRTWLVMALHVLKPGEQ